MKSWTLDAANLYYMDYAGYAPMQCHDNEENELKRWFDNYKISKDAYFATAYEWLVVEDVTATAKNIKTLNICSIGNDRTNERREVIMDHTTPPPPVVFFAAKIKYEPPPPKTAAELAREEQYRRMSQRNRLFDYDYRPQFEIAREFDSRMTMHMLTTWSFALTKPRPIYSAVDSGSEPSKFATTFVAPPAPKHRRNQ
jgi:hypothetical protein